MTNREVRAALDALAKVNRVLAVDMGPNDVIVLETDQHVSDAAINGINLAMAKVWPGRRVIVFDAGMKFQVVREVAAGAEGVQVDEARP